MTYEKRHSSLLHQLRNTDHPLVGQLLHCQGGLHRSSPHHLPCHHKHMRRRRSGQSQHHQIQQDLLQRVRKLHQSRRRPAGGSHGHALQAPSALAATFDLHPLGGNRLLAFSPNLLVLPLWVLPLAPALGGAVAERLPKTVPVIIVDLVHARADLPVEEPLRDSARAEIRQKKSGRNKNMQEKRRKGAESVSAGTSNRTQKHLETSSRPIRANQAPSGRQRRIAIVRKAERLQATTSAAAAPVQEGRILGASLPRHVALIWSYWASRPERNRPRKISRKLTESWQCDGIPTGHTTAKRQQKPQKSSKLPRMRTIISWRSTRSVDAPCIFSGNLLRGHAGRTTETY